jgi:Ca-activated chloride channel family protein
MRGWCGLLFATVLCAEVGVLLPGDQRQPDAAKLALESVDVRITIHNHHAKVSLRQVFVNRTGEILEGTYLFAIPGRALISGFAVWDDVTRIPGVILERRRAEELYRDIRAQAIDPGLLQQGESDEDRGTVFSAKVVPIPAYGRKRIEIEYQERLAVEDLQAFLALPLRPDLYRAQTAGRVSLSVEVQSNHALRSLEAPSKLYPLTVSERTPKRVVAQWTGTNVVLAEDFTLQYALDGQREALEVSAYRDNQEPGFFEVSALVSPPRAAEVRQAPKLVTVLFDASLSMQWDKLERSFQALEMALRALRPDDRFQVLVYHSEVKAFEAQPTNATPAAIDRALAFVKQQRLTGGTNLQAALAAALAQTGPDPHLVLLGDGGATRGLIQPGKLGDWYAAEWAKLASKPKTFVLAIGDDANQTLLRTLARQQGVFEWVRSTEPLEFKLRAFLSKLHKEPIGAPRLQLSGAATSLVYALDGSIYPGGNPAWVGRYATPGSLTATLEGQRGGRGWVVRNTAALPARATEAAYLPRAWAKARVDALLEKIDREGEDTATIEEIIRLSRQYKFVTPYTSFLAAPRSLLRPRLIRPGDPVLRVRTDRSIASVVAVFPFGLVKKLRYLDGEDMWQTRFLAPPDLADGTYRVDLLLRDQAGRVFQEAKTFVIAGTPPSVKVKLDRARCRAGDVIQLTVQASGSTRTLVARLPGAAPVALRWNPAARANTGALTVPRHLPAGRYAVQVTAEDFAHNIGQQEALLEIVP